MFIIVSKKNEALDIAAHEKMVVKNPNLYYSDSLNLWAVKVSGKFKHPYPTVKTLTGEGWICQ